MARAEELKMSIHVYAAPGRAPDGPYYAVFVDGHQYAPCWPYSATGTYAAADLAAARLLVAKDRAFGHADAHIVVSNDLGRTWQRADDNGQPMPEKPISCDSLVARPPTTEPKDV